jgi:hypothetical protein
LLFSVKKEGLYQMTIQESIEPLGNLLELVEEKPGTFAESFSMSAPWLNKETSSLYVRDMCLDMHARIF